MVTPSSPPGILPGVGLLTAANYTIIQRLSQGGLHCVLQLPVNAAKNFLV